MDITGKNIVITGGARGMGRRFAEDLLKAGAKPFVVDVLQENLDILKNETGIDGQIVDVSSENSVEAFFGQFSFQFLKPD